MNAHSDNYYDHNALLCIKSNTYSIDIGCIHAHLPAPASVCAMLQIKPLTVTC
jgi:hypothetical protein